ncbi:MAG TPA: UvrD-helicase domain-containing protein [Bryobacteraceae bacterium]|nr:UvrD-helicase domain-containing protein [Bryobacteraceae bacterium]
MNFTDHQEHAIRWLRQDACVVAGPGSGKTTVLVERYRSLIAEHKLEPREILAITFTEKAAANMKQKIVAQFAHDPFMRREIDVAWISTIHGFCARVLRENAIAAGIDPRFAQLDARESDDLQFDCIASALDELVDRRRAEALELIPALHTPYLANDLKSAYDGIRSAGRTIAEVRAMPCPTPAISQREMAGRLRDLMNWTGRVTPLQQSQRSEQLEFAERLESADDLFALVSGWKLNLQRVPADRKTELKEFRETLKAWVVDRRMAPFRAMVFDILARFDELYNERKTASGALDFNDLERRTIGLLRANPDVQRRIRGQFRQIMLDEFQDINEQQNELIDLIRSVDGFFAVGDTNQSIYGFRHARPEIFHRYLDAVQEQGKHHAELLDNFRSRAEILGCVGALLNSEAGIDPRALIAAAEFEPKENPSVEVLRVQTAEGDEAGEREAAWLAHRILDLRARDGFDFRDYAVLCRNGDSMRPILEAFGRAGIPYVCGRRQSFLLAREGLDITALLHTIANPRDTISLATVLRSPLVGLSDEAMLRLRLLAGSLSGGLNVIAFDPLKLTEFGSGDAAKLSRFAADLKRWRAEQPVIPLDLLIVRALRDCGFELNENVESFLQLARTRGDRKTLLHFLQEIESLQRAVSTESDLSDEDQGNCVQVMTAHAAKGLEFPVTIIAAMEKGTQRTSAPVTFTPEFGLGLKWNDPSSKDGIEDSWQMRNSDSLKERDKAESNRLLYVAMTRAEQHLILSYSAGDRKPANWAKLVDSMEIRTDVAGDPPPVDIHHADVASAKVTEIVPAPLITGQHDSSVNVTSLTLFANCPRKYYIQRYVGWQTGGRFRKFDPEDPPQERSDETPAAELGSFVHEILAGKTADYPAEAHRLARVFGDGPLGNDAANATRSAREWDFIVDIDDMMVRGVIDLWFEADGQIRIVDYKTDDVTAADAAVRAAEYAPQLAIYALALERAFGIRPASAHLHFLRPDTIVEVPIDIDQVHLLIAGLKQAQSGPKFDLYEGPHCRSCQFYRGLCPAPLGPVAY